MNSYDEPNEYEEEQAVDGPMEAVAYGILGAAAGALCVLLLWVLAT